MHTPSSGTPSFQATMAQSTVSGGANQTRSSTPRHGRSSPGIPRKILFYEKGAPFYAFTNFSPHPITYKGKRYPTSEHLFQAFKFLDHHPDVAERIRKCGEGPMSAFDEAHRQQKYVRPDWKQVNIQKMDITLRLKFTQHPDLKATLLGTGDAELVEDSPRDSFWGIGADRSGRNELGKALMRLREELRHGRKSPSPNPTPRRASPYLSVPDRLGASTVGSGTGVSQNSGLASSDYNGLCEICRVNPKYPGSHYCGQMQCANTTRMPSPRPVDIGTAISSGAGYQNTSSQGIPKSRVDGCLLCGNPTKNGHFCGQACTSKAESSAPRLIEIPNTHHTFTTVVCQFKGSWYAPRASPTIRWVYAIVQDVPSMREYEKYKASGSATPRWHGTTRACLLGDNGNTTLCSSASCSLCNIIRTSYKCLLPPGKPDKAIYTSLTPSKSDEHSKNTKHSNQKAILLNHVVSGKPRGHGSASNNSPQGGFLNNNDAVGCMDANAIIPSYLVIYDA